MTSMKLLGAQEDLVARGTNKKTGYKPVFLKLQPID